MTSRTPTLLLLCALAPVANADQLTIPPELVGVSPATTNAVRTVSRMAGELNRPLCFRGDPYYPGKFQQSLAAIQALPAGPERDKAQAYHDAIKAFADYEQNGPTQHGGWNGLSTKLQGASASLPTGSPKTEEETRTAVTALKAAAAKAAELLTLAKQVSDYSFCGRQGMAHHIAKLDPAGFAATVEATAATLANDARYAVDEAVRRSDLSLTDPNMNKWEMLQQLRAARARLPVLELWAPLFSKPADRARYAGRGAHIDAAEGKLVPFLVGQIKSTKPDKAIKDAKALGIAKKFLAAFEPYIDLRVIEKMKSVTKKGDIKERGDRRYIGTTKYKAFRVQRVIKHSVLKRTDLPALPGIDPADLCILDTGVLIKYDTGFEVALHTWMFDGSSEAGGPLMLCSNK